MTLLEKQQKFSVLLSELLYWLHSQDYGVTMGETWRSVETAALYAKQGKGIQRSLHTLRLAVDLNLFLDGQLLTRTEDYEKAGLYWEELGPDCSWGGHFGDGCHFSISHNGVR